MNIVRTIKKTGADINPLKKILRTKLLQEPFIVGLKLKIESKTGKSK